MKFFIIIVFCLYSVSSYSAENNFFTKGKTLFDQKKITESKIEFERSIVSDPKHVNSYIYLSKIFAESKKQDEEKKNLTTALLLNSKNEEALYLMSLLNIKEGDYKSLEKNYAVLKLNCSKFCDQLNDLHKSIKKFNKS
jgi:tetratricopeptide (TPR) repeat protein|tara:strand:+ start:442 stop:858 length:417 start_codon:yes stop_codon:yes gene_type:complete